MSEYMYISFNATIDDSHNLIHNVSNTYSCIVYIDKFWL